MRVYAITYDLNRPGQQYDVLFQAIKSTGTYWHFMQNAWLVGSNETSMQLVDRLTKHIDSNDKLFVVRVDESAWTGFDLEQSNWIKRQVAAAA